jgi:hypothetical protein
MDKYHYELLKIVSNMYNINYDEMCKKIPFKQKYEPPDFNSFLSEYKQKSLKELQEIALEYGCSKSGKKDAIIKRIYDILLSKKLDNEYTIIEHINIHEIPQKKDECVGTDNIVDTSSIVQNRDDIIIEQKYNNKCIDLSDKDLILLLQTHNLSIMGSRNELIERLKDFYKKNVDSKNKNKNKNIDEYLLGLDDDDYVSRHEMSDKMMHIMQNAIKISITDNQWKYIIQLEDTTDYVLVPNKNWIFKETDIAYEFIGIANNDNTFNRCDIPDELALIS